MLAEAAFQEALVDVRDVLQRIAVDDDDRRVHAALVGIAQLRSEGPCPLGLLELHGLAEQACEHVPVSIYLVNGIKLQGHIESFDQYVVLLRNTVTQMVYKHAISTVVPGRAVNFHASESEEG